MAMSHVIRTTYPTLVPCLPLGTNSISFSRVNNNILPYKSKYTRRLHVKNATSFHSDQFYTAQVDQKLVKVLEYEVKSTDAISLFEGTKYQIPLSPPADFPFSIDEHSSDCSVKCKRDIYSSVPSLKLFKSDKYSCSDISCLKFKRDLHEERIEVCVCEPTSTLTRYVDMSSDSESDDENNNNSIPVVPLVVKIIKKDQTFIDVTVLGSADVLFIKRMDIHVPRDPDDRGTSFDVHSISKLTWSRDVQYSMKEFIEARGINKTNAQFWLKFSEHYYKYQRGSFFLKAFKEYFLSL